MIYNKSIGTSVKGLEIIAWSNFDLHSKQKKPFTLLIGGMHGNERAPVPILETFISRYVKTGNINNSVCVIPVLNPDGYKANTRFNANGVDLNRNFPFNWRMESEEPSGTAPLSEPETKALYRFIQKYIPDKIVNLHWALSEIDADGKQSVGLAKKLWKALPEEEKRKYRFVLRSSSFDQKVECPGSLGQWCGYGLCYPGNRRPAMITLELPYTTDTDRNLHLLPENNFDSMVTLWEKDPLRYLKATEPAVLKLLYTACS